MTVAESGQKHPLFCNLALCGGWPRACLAKRGVYFARGGGLKGEQASREQAGCWKLNALPSMHAGERGRGSLHLRNSDGAMRYGCKITGHFGRGGRFWLRTPLIVETTPTTEAGPTAGLPSTGVPLAMAATPGAETAPATDANQIAPAQSLALGEAHKPEVGVFVLGPRHGCILLPPRRARKARKNEQASELFSTSQHAG